VAPALAASGLGRSVVLTDEGYGLGGQLASQGVPLEASSGRPVDLDV
jgi:hypothetical protein